jgi:N-acyl-D-aspartate/D-glutamate deacylase
LPLHHPELRHDLPAGGKRLVQRVDGYEATIVAGDPMFERGEETGGAGQAGSRARVMVWLLTGRRRSG